MTTQDTKDQSDTPRTDAAQWRDSCTYFEYLVFADLARQLERELTEAKRSLRREENARKVLADENERLRAQTNELRDEVNDLERKVTALEHAG